MNDHLKRYPFVLTKPDRWWSTVALVFAYVLGLLTAFAVVALSAWCFS